MADRYCNQALDEQEEEQRKKEEAARRAREKEEEEVKRYLSYRPFTSGYTYRLRDEEGPFERSIAL